MPGIKSSAYPFWDKVCVGFCGSHPFRKGRGMGGAPRIRGGAGMEEMGGPPAKGPRAAVRFPSWSHFD
jgi:hypothetical protein